MKKCILPLLILSFIFLIDYGSVKKVDDVVIFVLDTRINSSVVEGKPVISSRDITHGSIVTRLLDKEAPAVTIIPLAVEEYGDLSREMYRDGLRRVIRYKREHPAHRVLVNISLVFDEYDREHHQLVKNLKQQGVIIIAAAGNDGLDEPLYPAAFRETVAVASATKVGKAPHSNYGSFIDLSAPGQLSDVFPLYYAGGLKYSRLETDGTSLAAPRVAGLLARVLTIKSDWQTDDALELITSTVGKINDDYYRQGLLGAGLIYKNRVLKNVDPYYYLKQPAFIVIIIFTLVVLYLWPSLGALSIFLSLLVLLAGIPLILLLEELWFLLRKGSIELSLLLIFVAVIAAAIIISLLIRRRKKYKLSRYLKETGTVNINQLVKMALNNNLYKDIIVNFLREKKGIEEGLITIIKKNNSIEEKRLAADILAAHSCNREVLDRIIKIIEPASNPVINSYSGPVETRIIALEVLAGYGEKAEELTGVVRKIIENKREDMWVRYQALRTLVAVQKNPAVSLSYLEKLGRDEQELIRIEARGLMGEIRNSEKKGVKINGKECF
ncbi:MAG: S8 family peptidase [Halanaerobiales bacterium]